MAKVFISYRRADSAAFAGRIYDRLVARFGRKNIFKDVDDIPAGVDFAEYIQSSLRQCAVELVIIGPQWIESRAADGALRLDDPNDFVRIEVETAFALGLTVIPILVDNARMPAVAQLPESLQRLHCINALSVRHDPDFARDMERVVAAIEHAFASRPSSGIFGRRGGPSPAPASGQAATVSPPFPMSAAVGSGYGAASPASSTLVGTAERPPAVRAPSRERRPTRLRVLAAASAVVLVAALATALFFARGYFGGGSTSNQTPISQLRIASVVMLADGHGWAVGDDGLILHETGGAWQRVNSPTHVTLTGIAMTSDQDGWAVGLNGTILRYTQGRWTEAQSPSQSDLFAISILPSGEAWAVGGSSIGNGSSLILHYPGGSGGEWTQIDFASTEVLLALAAGGNTDVWAGGANGSVLHYNGVWAAKGGGSDGSSPLTSRSISGIALGSSSDAWAVGGSGGGNFGPASQFMMHFSGGAWASVTITVPDRGILNANLFGIAMTQSTGFAVGQNGEILHFSAGTWTEQAAPNQVTTVTLRSVAVLPGGTEGWATGDKGTILHYIDGAWSPYDDHAL